MKFLNHRNLNSLNAHYLKSVCHHFCIADLGFSSHLCLHVDFGLLVLVQLIFQLTFYRIVFVGVSTN